MTISDDPNKKDIERIVREGASSEFWKVMVRAIDENIETLDRVFLSELKGFGDLQSDECKVRLMTYLAEKAHFEHLKDLPLLIIGEVKDVKEVKEKYDVYDKAKDFLPKN